MLKIQIKKKLSQFNLNVDFTITNEIVVLFGHSGSGKTTILNSIAGLIHPDSGVIKLHEQTFFGEKVFLSTKKRNIGYLFQDYALFPHMTVEKNIKYGIRKKDHSLKLLLLNQILDVLSIKHLLKKYPHQISGGEKQRVALARALATEPSILLLDEPLSALDQDTRIQCQDELLRLHKLWNIPFVIVTHDRDEAEKLGDKIFFIDKGEIIKSKVRGEDDYFLEAANETIKTS